MNTIFKTSSILFLFIFCCGIALADESDMLNLENQKNEFVKSLKNTSNENEIDSIIEQYLKKSSQLRKRLNLNFKKSGGSNLKNNFIINSNKPENFDIGNGNKLMFLSDGSIAKVKSTFSCNTKSASDWHEKKVTKEFKKYSWLGLKIFKITVKGNFYYNGEEAKAKLKSASFNKPFYSIWDVGSWSTGSYDSSSSSDAEIYGYGDAELNVPVADKLGIDLSVQSFSVEARITCDENGNIDDEFVFEN